MSYHVIESDVGKFVLDDLSKLFGQIRILHALGCQSPFRDWFYLNKQYDVQELVWFSILPAAVSTAYRLLDQKSKTQSLKALLDEYDANAIQSTNQIRDRLTQFRNSNSYNRLLVHRHQFVAHRGTESAAARKLADDNESTEWNMEDAVRTLVNVAQLTTDIWKLGSAYSDLPPQFDYLDLRSMKFVLRLFGANIENPREQWMCLTNRNHVPSVLELFE